MRCAIPHYTSRTDYLKQLRRGYRDVLTQEESDASRELQARKASMAERREREQREAAERAEREAETSRVMCEEMEREAALAASKLELRSKYGNCFLWSGEDEGGMTSSRSGGSGSSSVSSMTTTMNGSFGGFSPSQKQNSGERFSRNNLNATLSGRIVI
eukprot:PhM_4_TR14395/c0_g1_i1/m.10203